MHKRKYTHIKPIEAEIIAMRNAGKSRREIAEHFGLEKGQIKDWVARYNRAQAKLGGGVSPRPKELTPKDAPPRGLNEEQAHEIDRLRMENKLLRDFLQLTGRK